MKLKDILVYAVVSTAVLLTAWKGTLDWMALAAVAVILKLPGTYWLRKIFRKD